MARLVERLNAAAIEAATVPGYYTDGAGLYLQVTKGGSRSWIFQYTLKGRTREMGLGSLTTFSLAEARKAARAARQQLSDGIDPLEAKRAQQAQEAPQQEKLVTFKEAAVSFIEDQRAGWKGDKSYNQWSNTLATYAYPVIGNVPVRDVDTPMVVQILKPIWTTKTETADRVRNRIERILDSCATLNQRSGPNPARWKGHLKNLFPAPSKVAPVQHYPALHYREIPEFITKLRQRQGEAARALEFCVLCAVRTADITGLPWKELDLAIGVWNLPETRAKTRDLRIPLSPPALAIIEERKAGSPDDCVFLYEGEPLSENAMLSLLGRMGYGHVTVHGFRSTFKDWAADCTNFDNTVSEMAMGHAVGNDTEAAYRRGELFEKRRQLMHLWARYCSGGLVPGATVVPMKQGHKKWEAFERIVDGETAAAADHFLAAVTERRSRKHGAKA